MEAGGWRDRELWELCCDDGDLRASGAEGLPGGGCGLRAGPIWGSLQGFRVEGGGSLKEQVGGGAVAVCPGAAGVKRGGGHLSEAGGLRACLISEDNEGWVEGWCAGGPVLPRPHVHP